MWFNRKGIICKLNDSEKATTALHLLNVSKDVLIYYVNSLRNHILIKTTSKNLQCAAL